MLQLSGMSLLRPHRKVYSRVLTLDSGGAIWSLSWLWDSGYSLQDLWRDHRNLTILCCGLEEGSEGHEDRSMWTSHSGVGGVFGLLLPKCELCPPVVSTTVCDIYGQDVKV